MNSRPKSKDALEGQWLLPLGAPREHAKRAEYRRCGDKSCSTCREGRGHGPYLYAVWRAGKQVKRKYLGKARP
jgi:hypothetical protein